MMILVRDMQRSLTCFPFFPYISFFSLLFPLFSFLIFLFFLLFSFLFTVFIYFFFFSILFLSTFLSFLFISLISIFTFLLLITYTILKIISLFLFTSIAYSIVTNYQRENKNTYNVTPLVIKTHYPLLHFNIIYTNSPPHPIEAPQQASELLILGADESFL